MKLKALISIISKYDKMNIQDEKGVVLYDGLTGDLNKQMLKGHLNKTVACIRAYKDTIIILL